MVGVRTLSVIGPLLPAGFRSITGKLRPESRGNHIDPDTM